MGLFNKNKQPTLKKRKININIHHLDQRSPIQRSQIDFNNYLMRNLDQHTLAFFSDSSMYKSGITDNIYMMGKYSDGSIVVLTKSGHVFIYYDKKWRKFDLGVEFVVDFEISPINLILKTRSGNVYAMSVYNTWNQVGIKGVSNLSDLKLGKLDAKVELLDAKTGYGHTYFLSKDRELYFCGNSGFGQPATSGDNIHDMTRISNSQIKGRKVKIIASGFANCLCIFDDGKGLVWGNNDHKQLGYDDGFEYLSNPKPLVIPSTFQVIGLSAGQNVSLAMMSNHEIFVAGEFLGMDDVWRRVQVDFAPQSIFDAYIWYNKVYILSKGKFFHLFGI